MAYRMTDRMRTASDGVTIASDRLCATVSPHGAELTNLSTTDGRELQWNGDPAFWTGRAPILFPVIGVLRDGSYRYDGRTYAMPKHGFARRSTFDVVARDERGATFRLAASDRTRTIYPFEFRLDVTFRLTDTSLSVTAAVGNRGDRPMPASFGFHPALRWPLPFGRPRPEHRLLFPEDEPQQIRRIDADGLLRPEPQPTPVAGDTLPLADALFVDDALIFDRLTSRSVRYGAAEGSQLRVDFADFPTLGVWTKPGAGFVCIEPWHGFSDPEGFVGDIRDKPGSFLVAPGAVKTLTMAITLEGWA